MSTDSTTQSRTPSKQGSMQVPLNPALPKIRMIFFIGFCLFMPFTIAYSQVCLAIALALYIWEALFGAGVQFSALERRLYLIVGLFIALSALSGIVNGSAVSSLVALKEEWLFLIIPLTVFLMREKIFSDWLWWLLLGSVCVIALYGWLQHFFGFNLRSDFLLYQSPDGLYSAWGNFHNRLTFGNLFATLGLFFVSAAVFQRERRWRIGFAITGALAVGAALFSYSRGSLIAMAVGSLVLLYFSFRRAPKLTLAVGALAVLALLVANPEALQRLKGQLPMELGQYETARERSNSRITIWSVSGEIVSENPVFGVGPGNFRAAYEATDSSLVRVYNHAHNDALNIAAYAGIPTALAYLAIWFYLLRRLWRSLRERPAPGFATALTVGALVGSVTFFTCSLAEAAFADEEVRVGLMLIWGFGIWAAEALEKQSASIPVTN